MAELAATAFAAIGSAFAASAPAAGAAAATTATTAATAAAATSTAAWAAGTTVVPAAAAASSGLLSTLQTVASIGGMISTLAAGYGAYQQGQQQATMARLDGEAEAIAAKDKALRIRRELVQTIGRNRVGFAASGVDISGGFGLEDDLMSQAEYESGITLAAGRQGQAMAGLRAENYRSQGRMRLGASAVKAFGQGAELGMDLVNRG